MNLKSAHTSGLENEIRLFASCSNEKECQNRGNSAKHKGVQKVPKCVIFKTLAAGNEVRRTN